jgi:AbiU2
MPKLLPIADQVTIAGELAYRCEVFYATWIAIAGRDSRARYRPAFDAHTEIWLTIQAAHVFALICTLHSLFETDSKKQKLTLQALSAHADDVAADLIAKSAVIARKVATLRHTFFAHRSGKLTTAEAFALAKVTPNEIRLLATRASAIVRIIAAHLDLPSPPQAIGARAAITNLMDAVARDTNATLRGV